MGSTGSGRAGSGPIVTQAYKRPAAEMGIDDMDYDYGDEVPNSMEQIDEDVELGEAGRNWVRPPPDQLEPSTASLGKALTAVWRIPLTTACKCQRRATPASC